MYSVYVKYRELTIGEGHVTDGCIHDIEVHEKYRNRGVATNIVKQLVSLGGNWMWVAVNDIQAIRIYESIGFRVSEKDGDFFKMTYQNCKSKVHMTANCNRNNGDNLRNMNNEELARYLWIETNRMTVEEWLDWLNREAK